MNLTVKPLKQKDAGRRLAAIDRIAADELDLSGGTSFASRRPRGQLSRVFGPATPKTTGAV